MLYYQLVGLTLPFIELVMCDFALYWISHVYRVTVQATVSLKVVSLKRRRNNYDLRLTIKSDRKVKSGGRYT
jgi:hypothetical protein